MEGNSPAPVLLSFALTVEMKNGWYRYRIYDFETIDGTSAHFNFNLMSRSVDKDKNRKGIEPSEEMEYTIQVLTDLDKQAKAIIDTLKVAMAK